MDPIINLNGKNNQVISDKVISGGTNICIHLTNCHDIHITRCTLNNSTNRGIRLDNCYNITIDYCYFDTLTTGVYAQKCTGAIVCNYNKLQNIANPLLTTTGVGSGIQYDQCSGAGYKINYNKIQITPTPFTGDLINITKSNGTSSSYMEVLYNQLRGGGTNNTFGPAGIVGGDVGGSYQNISYNTLVNTGYAGIQIQGGTHITCQYNKIFSAKTITYSGLGLGVANYSGVPAGTGDIVSLNRINWWGGVSNIKAQRDLVYKPENNNTKPAGFDTNTHDATLSDAILPNPLWSYPSPPSGKTVIAGKTVIIK